MRVFCGLLLTLALAGCSTTSGTLRPFTSDGCSLFPDRSLCNGGNDWCHCCLEHDHAYWRGGTRKQRRTADQELKACIADVTNSALQAKLMYAGVRLGGSPYLYTWFRWGYGWKGLRGYRPLSDSETARADALEAASPPPGVCSADKTPKARTAVSRPR